MKHVISKEFRIKKITNFEEAKQIPNYTNPKIICKGSRSVYLQSLIHLISENNFMDFCSIALKGFIKLTALSFESIDVNAHFVGCIEDKGLSYG